MALYFVFNNGNKNVGEKNDLSFAKIQQHYEETPDSCRQVVLGYVTHYEEVQQVSYLTFFCYFYQNG